MTLNSMEPSFLLEAPLVAVELLEVVLEAAELVVLDADPEVVEVLIPLEEEPVAVADEPLLVEVVAAKIAPEVVEVEDAFLADAVELPEEEALDWETAEPHLEESVMLSMLV